MDRERTVKEEWALRSTAFEDRELAVKGALAAFIAEFDGAIRVWVGGETHYVIGDSFVVHLDEHMMRLTNHKELLLTSSTPLHAEAMRGVLDVGIAQDAFFRLLCSHYEEAFDYAYYCMASLLKEGVFQLKIHEKEEDVGFGIFN